MSPHVRLTAMMRGVTAGAWLAAAALASQGALGQAAHAPRARMVATVADPTAAPVITLERMACHGECAEYKLSFYGDGQVVYDGKANVSKAGRWRATVSKQIVSDLVADFGRIRFQSLQDKYPAGLTETSTAVTSLRIGQQVKTVTHDVGSPFPPPDLVALEDRIDAAVQSVNWVR